MPQILRIGSYVVYFWSNEVRPLEYVHVHVASKRPTVDATKLWITSVGGVVVCNNDSQIPPEVLRKIARVVEANNKEIVATWVRLFGVARYYC